MNKVECTKEMLSGNNTLNNLIIRVDFLTISVDEIVERFMEYLGDQYVYNKIDKYDINFDISDPKKLITQDFVKQKVNLYNNYEFKSVNDELRFVINQNFLLYERKNFKEYTGSQSDTNIYLDLLNILFEYEPKIQRLGIRKSNVLYIEQDINKLKGVLDNSFIKNLDENLNQKFNLIYTPMDENQKDGYNLLVQLDYGKINIDDENKDVYRVVIDIDSYIRETTSIDNYSKVKDEIEVLKLKDFDIYIGQMSSVFLDAITKNDESSFKKSMNDIGVLYGANYGKH